MFIEMAGKRAASTDLNHDNWDDEEKPEEAGTFKKASDDVLEKRIVKKAKRRLQNSEDSTRNVFGTFTGFKTKTSTSASPFSFLANNNTNISANDMASKTVTNVNKSSNNETPKTNENGTNKRENTEIQTSSTMFTSKNSTSDKEEQNIFKKSTDYFAKLKGLNESVAQWIKTHVDANPFCILTPIFKDYERYLKEIEAKHGSEIERSTQAQCSDNKEIANTDKNIESSPFGRTHAKAPLKSAEWKPEKSIFGNINPVSKSIFKKSEHTVNTGKPIFSTDQNSGSPKSVFDSIDQKSGSKNIFGSTSSEKNPFLSKPPTASDKSEEQETKLDSKPTTTTIVTNTTITSSFATTNTATFCFGQSSAASNTSTGFSFGSTKPFTFGAQVVQPQEPEDEGKDDENEEPPKADFKPVTEEGAIYEQRCKVFVKKDGNFTDRGIGTLFLKPTPNEKTQLLVRAETSLGNLLLNTLLTESIPTKRMNKNTIMLLCLPMPESTPPPVPVLLRVKTDEDADILLETLNKHKK
ncbi:nuclear pore complex protein Nup50 isoform X1 [Bombus impatiens]|uniref:Nuclear pore complex protein Nup50 isoform X1 n=2 Tax=Bombus impatiens TaxID=132113 RepID=A0A6P3V5U3_BOMIM|nr:nuclear pore complex protein Nup50 isoform X1 [Bombus impatiens]